MGEWACSKGNHTSTVMHTYASDTFECIILAISVISVPVIFIAAGMLATMHQEQG